MLYPIELLGRFELLGKPAESYRANLCLSCLKAILL